MDTTTDKATGVARLRETLLESPQIYSLWQRPWVRGKLEPLLAHNDIESVESVLDLGCGPGTNAPWFKHADYVGVDINPRYVATARRTCPGEFTVGDVRDLGFLTGRKFDFVLLNSFLHHVDDAGAETILRSASRLLNPGGTVHVLDLVLPAEPSLARFLARQDRGDYARPLRAWRELLSATFELIEFEPYPLRTAGVTLWHMVYAKGRVAS